MKRSEGTAGRLRAGLAAAAAALAFGAAGCGGGGDETPPAEAWADDVCSAVLEWQQAMEDAGQSLISDGLSRTSVERAAQDARRASDQLAEELRELGTPDTESGPEAKEAIDGLADTLSDAVDEIEQTLADTSGLSELPGAIADVTAAISSMTSAVSETFDTLQALDAEGELRDGFESAESCDTLVN